MIEVARRACNRNRIGGKERLTHRRLLQWSLVLAVGLLLPLQASQSFAQDENHSSLDIVPQSAAFFYASMNHEAQLDAILDSNAWDRLMDSPVGKSMRSAYRKGKRRGFDQFGWGNPFADYLRGYRESVGSEMAPLIISPIKQILGQEVFIYAENDWLELGKAMGEFYSEAGEFMKSVDQVENMTEADIKGMLSLARTHLENAQTPTLVFGTVLNEPDGVKSLLQMAENAIDGMIGQMPEEMNPVVDGFDVIDEKNLYMLTLQLDADSLPWEEIEDDADMAPYIDDIKAIAKNKTFNISIGIKDHFLLVAVSDSNEHIMEMGKGELLRDHPKFAPLREKAGNKRLTSVAYYSEEAAGNSAEQMAGIIDTVINFAEVGIRSSGEEELLRGLTDDLKEDAAELKEDLKPMIGKSGARLGFSYMYEGGIEGYVYNWAENKFYDASKPLTILKHVGPSPTLVSAGRNTGSAEQISMTRKWFGKGFGYATKYVPRGMNNSEDALRFVQVAGEVRSVLGDLGDSVQEEMIPAIAGQDAAFVMDWSNKKRSWHTEMPTSSKPLPGPAMSVIASHTNRQGIIRTGEGIYEAAVEMLEIIRNIPGSDVPDEFDFYPPEQQDTEAGEFHMYRLPAEAGLDDDVAMHAFVSDSHFVLGHSLEQTNRLLAEHDGNLDEIANASNPAMSIFYYNNERMVDALNAWAGYVIEQVKANGGSLDLDYDAENDLLEFNEEQLMETWDRAIDLAKCFKGISSRSYSEDGAQVTHYRMRFQDVPDEE